MNVLESFLAAHPVVQTVLLVPLVSGLLSVAFDRIGTRWPLAGAVLKAAGFDAAGVVKAFLEARRGGPRV